MDHGRIVNTPYYDTINIMHPTPKLTNLYRHIMCINNCQLHINVN